MEMRPNKRIGLVPAKNGEKIGVADQKSMKFFELNEAYLNIWILCDGSKTIDEIANEFSDLAMKSLKGKKPKKQDLIDDAKKIINKLLKFNLIE